MSKYPDFCRVVLNGKLQTFKGKWEEENTEWDPDGYVGFYFRLDEELIISGSSHRKCEGDHMNDVFAIKCCDLVDGFDRGWYDDIVYGKDIPILGWFSRECQNGEYVYY